MTYLLDPGPGYRYVLKRGMSGTDIAALQINLPTLVVDGTFGAHTEQAVKAEQVDAGLTADGIAGLATQQAMCIDRSQEAASARRLPAGMLKSLMANESGFAVAAWSQHPSDWGYDMGAYQLSIGPHGAAATQANFEHGYSIKEMANATATSIRAQHDAFPTPVPSRYFNDLSNGDKDRFAWCLAVNNHNWPYASEQIYERGHIYLDPTVDDKIADWVVSASGGRLSTPRQWVYAYVVAATKFVKW